MLRAKWLLHGAAAFLLLFTPVTAQDEEVFNVPVWSITTKGQTVQIHPIQDTYLVDITSYNPEVGQTDSSPCIGAHGTDLCVMASEGIATIALSQNLVGRHPDKPFHYGDIVMIEHEMLGCNGVFQVEDTMNARFGATDRVDGRADIFRMERHENHGLCRGAKLWKLH